jgi:hypothetical protein
MPRQLRSFDLPMGAQLSATEARGYPIDFRVKAPRPEWPPAWLASHLESYVSVAQRGLGYYEHYLAGEGEAWRRVAISAAEWLVGRQETSGQAAGAWLHRYTYPHTFPLRPPWVSAMAQGEAASLLIRIYHETSEAKFAEAAVNAMRPLSRTPHAGGAMAQLEGGIFLEEYPTDPPSCVLNGGMFAIWGCFDVARALAVNIYVNFNIGFGCLALSTTLTRHLPPHLERPGILADNRPLAPLLYSRRDACGVVVEAFEAGEAFDVGAEVL